MTIRLLNCMFHQCRKKGFVQFFQQSKYSTNILQKVGINYCIKNNFHFSGQLENQYNKFKKIEFWNQTA